MPQKGPNTVHILEGTATLFRRPSTPHWHVRYKIHGEWLRTSTKCIALAQARKAAVDIVMQAKFREQNSLPIVNKRFKQVAKLAIARMDDLQRIGQGKSTFKTYTQALEKYFIPLIGNHNVDKIDRSVLSKFDAERLVMMGKAPSASVLNNHNSAINRVFDEALERGYMTKFQVPMLSNTGFKSERRPDFTAEEYKLLYKGMRKWVLSARSGNEGLMRRVLREYVLVLANTGMRAGTEGMNLKWSNVYFFTKDDAKYLALWVDGKTKAHEMTARHAAVVPVTLEFKYLVQFMVNSFIRPSDLRVLRRSHVKVQTNPAVKKKADKHYLLLTHPATKTTDQEVVTMPAAYGVYKSLITLQDEKVKALKAKKSKAVGKYTDHLFFPEYPNRSTMIAVAGRIFSAVVKRAGLQVVGEKHTLYSLRHTSLMYRLLLGNTSTLELARNARTSQAMIDKHYASRLTPQMAVDSIHSFK